jgi:hypothetical protein
MRIVVPETTEPQDSLQVRNSHLDTLAVMT